MSFQFDPSRPIYFQIQQEIKKRAARGVYAPGGKLPSIRDLSADMEVNTNTTARAYMELEREGFVVTRRGEGSFVADDLTLINAERDRLAAEAAESLVVEIRSLALGPKQIESLLKSIKRGLSDG